MNAYLALAAAIVLETAATTMLKASDGFSKVGWGLGALATFAVCFVLLAHTLRTIPTGIAYAIWSGAGIVLVSTAGWLFLKQRLDAPAIIGIGLILCGVLVMQLFSKAAVH